MKPLTFSGGGGSSSFKETADSLLTNDTVEVLIGLSEGPIQGPVNGPKSFYADGTQLVNNNGEPNFSNFTISFWPGSDPPGDTVTMALGGFASPVQVEQELFKDVAVIRQGQQTQITAVDFRVVINQLYKQDSKGVYTDNLQLKFEFKSVDDEIWLPCFSEPTFTPPTDTSPAGTIADWTIQNPPSITLSFLGDTFVLPINAPPTAAPPTPTNPALAIDPTGNVYTWNTGSLEWFQVETTAGAGNVIQFQDTVGDKVVTRYLFRNQTSTPNAHDMGDVWDTGNGVFLIWNGSAWVTPGVFDESQYQPDPIYLNDGVWSWNGKVSSNTAVNIRVYVPAINEQYQYRVTKLSTDTTTQEFSVVTWESVEEIKQSSWTFDNLAMVKIIGQASDQFTSLPQWQTLAQGRIVKVPTNYDPVARTYTGVWDGTYKLAYTNNPAWVFKDFVENTRYGLSSVYPHVCDPFSIYNWAQYCDAPVPTAAGGTQPRWTYNDWITQPRDAVEMAQYIAGSAGALYIDDGNGNVVVMIDEDVSAVALFTPENVTDDGFQYSYTDRLTRANQTIVSFANPVLNYQTDKRIVVNSDDIAAFGTISDDFIATGCTDPDEALRRARRRQVSGLTEKEFISFQTNRKGKFLKLWDVILAADPDMGRGLTGRIKTAGTNSVTLRDPISLEAGFTYQAVFEVPDVTATNAYTTVTLNVTTPAGTVTTLSFDADLPVGLPEYAVFTLQCATLVGLPKPYRVISLEDDSSNGELVRVTALELNRNKYTYIDTAQDLGVLDYSNFSDVVPAAPTNFQIAASLNLVGASTDRVLTLSWDPSTTSWTRDYTLTWTIDGNPAGTITTANLSIDIHNANRGRYIFNLVANAANGRSSTAVQLGYDTVGVTASVDAPRKLQLKNGDVNYDTNPADDTLVLTQPSPVVFSAPDATFVWRPAATPHPNFAGYIVRIYLPGQGTPIRSEQIGDVLTYTYDFAKNKLDGLNREFTFSVAAVDQDGNESSEVTLEVNNPPPATAEAVIVLNPYVLNLQFQPPNDLDYGGIIVSMATVSGAEVPVYQDKGNPSIKIDPGITYFIKYAFFDTFGTSGLNWSAEVGVTSPQINSTDIQNFNTQVLDVVTSVTGDITNLEADVNEALSEAGTAANATTDYQLNLQALQDYVNALAYVEGQPVGDFAQATQVQTDGLQSSMDLMGVKSVDGQTFVMNTTTVTDKTGVAIATTLSNLTSSINGNIAALTTESTTRASADSSISASVTSLTATVNGNTASITNESITRANADSSLSASITSLTATVNGNSSAITNEQIARANGDSANAASISSLTATVNGQSATITTIQSVQADHTGKLQAYFGIVAAAGSNPAYLLVNATGYGSTIALAATSIALYDTGSGNPIKVMEVIGGFAHFSTLTITDAGTKRLIQGPAFGANSDLVLWFGSNSVAPGSATKANSTFALATDGKVYYGGTDLGSQTGSGPSPGLSASSISYTYTGPYPGTATSGAVTATLTGAVGTVSYVWLTSSTKMTINGVNSQTVTFSASLLNSSSEEDATIVCVMTDNGTGKQYQQILPVTISGNA